MPRFKDLDEDEVFNYGDSPSMVDGALRTVVTAHFAHMPRGSRHHFYLAQNLKWTGADGQRWTGKRVFVRPLSGGFTEAQVGPDDTPSESPAGTVNSIHSVNFPVPYMPPYAARSFPSTAS